MTEDLAFMIAFALIAIGALGGLIVTLKAPKKPTSDEHSTARFI